MLTTWTARYLCPKIKQCEKKRGMGATEQELRQQGLKTETQLHILVLWTLVAEFIPQVLEENRVSHRYFLFLHLVIKPQVLNLCFAV